jgi:hypothetical protein
LTTGFAFQVAETTTTMQPEPGLGGPAPECEFLPAGNLEDPEESLEDPKKDRWQMLKGWDSPCETRGSLTVELR